MFRDSRSFGGHFFKTVFRYSSGAGGSCTIVGGSSVVSCVQNPETIRIKTSRMNPAGIIAYIRPRDMPLAGLEFLLMAVSFALQRVNSDTGLAVPFQESEPSHSRDTMIILIRSHTASVGKGSP